MGTMFNRRLINQNKKAIKDNNDADVALTARVAALEGAGYSVVDPDPEGEATAALTKVEIDGTVYGISGGGGSTNLITETLNLTSILDSNGDAISGVSGTVQVIHDGTNIISVRPQITCMPMLTDFASALSGCAAVIAPPASGSTMPTYFGWAGTSGCVDFSGAKMTGYVPFIADIEPENNGAIYFGTIVKFNNNDIVTSLR